MEAKGNPYFTSSAHKAYEEGRQAGRQEGIREVVEWIESLENEPGAENVCESRGNTSGIYLSPFFKPKIFRDKWQALKSGNKGEEGWEHPKT